MSDPIETPPPSNSAALARWLVVIVVTFGALIGGFFWISGSLLVPDHGTGDTAGDASVGAAAAPTEEYPAPDFRLASLEGKTIGPLDFEGEAVVIDFWATWCGPCKLQAKMLEQLHEEMDGKGVRFLAVNVGEDLEKVERYVADSPFPYSVLLDPEEQLSVRYQIYGLPTVMVVDREGRVSFLRTGLTDIPTLRKVLAKAGVNA